MRADAELDVAHPALASDREETLACPQRPDDLSSNPEDPHGRRKEPTLTNCPLTSTLALGHGIHSYSCKEVTLDTVLRSRKKIDQVNKLV